MQGIKSDILNNFFMLIIFSLCNIKSNPATIINTMKYVLSIKTPSLQWGLFSLPATAHQQGENCSQFPENGGGG